MKNSLKLKNRTMTWVIDGNTYFVSYDVNSLYPKVPIGKAIEVLTEIISGDATLAGKTPLSVQSIQSLLKFCLENSYFEESQKWYKIPCGMIGLDLMGVVADLYLENHEMRAVR